MRGDAWRSCCFDLDRSFISFLVQVLVGIGLIAFCIERIIVLGDDCCKTNAFFSFMSFLVGLIIPSPLPQWGRRSFREQIPERA